RFRRNYGKSAALNEGFAATQGDIIITMDADLQDSPDEIPELRRRILEEDLDLISGWKQKRYDPITKTLPTKLFNWATRKMSGIYLHDFNCGLKAYRSEVTKSIEVYGEMHRYIPVIAKWAGFRKIGEQVVQHQARKYGHTKFGWNRFINGFLDLMSIFFVGKFGKKPMHFFGLWGTLMFVIGFIASAYIGIDKLYALSIGEPAIKVTDNPWFYIALTTMILGTQLFLAGFIGELIGRSASDRNHYLVKERI
ncbi:MAG: glycosyltransferase, partial [Bacteroidota bacterium]|nr:glycosyltransferase [Bacteroidota bacterium]MDX5429711.1 glycosyltransferase [Bacteroidota bacterium]MDX5468492.1 glycosyltransferase [Bacteroidota bacterium]